MSDLPEILYRSDDEPEAALIRRLQRGDHSALEPLMRRHHGALERLAFRRLPRSLLRKFSVADLLQETRMVAVRKCQEFADRGPGSFRNWLLAILELNIKEYLRHYRGAARRDVRREVTRGARPDTSFLAGKEPSPSQAAIASELSVLARAALAALSPRDREVLRLAREEKRSLREVAETIGATYEATKKRYARALARFTAEFESRLGGHDGKA